LERKQRHSVRHCSGILELEEIESFKERSALLRIGKGEQLTGKIDAGVSEPTSDAAGQEYFDSAPMSAQKLSRKLGYS
jgi:hypothetical protein